MNNSIKMSIFKSLYLLILLQFTSVMAGPDYTDSSSVYSDPNAFNSVSAIAPVTPRVATFEEYSEGMSLEVFPEQSPSTPNEADFYDSPAEIGITPMELAPVTPREADFESVLTSGNNLQKILAPAVPAVADFDDTF